MADGVDDGLPHDVSVVTERLATFYGADQLDAMKARLEAYLADGSFMLPSGELVADAFISRVIEVDDAVGVFARAIRLTLDNLSVTAAGYHVVDVHVIEAALAEVQPGSRAGEVALAEVELLLQSTYANAGDNDLDRSIAGAEHLLLDLETLFTQGSKI